MITIARPRHSHHPKRLFRACTMALCRKQDQTTVRGMNKSQHTLYWSMELSLRNLPRILNTLDLLFPSFFSREFSEPSWGVSLPAVECWISAGTETSSQESSMFWTWEHGELGLARTSVVCRRRSEGSGKICWIQHQKKKLQVDASTLLGWVYLGGT